MPPHPQMIELFDRMMPMVKHFHANAQFAPHAATMDMAGEVTGQALTTDGRTQLTLEQTIEYFEARFRAQAQAGQILASGVFYHGSGIRPGDGIVTLPPATVVEEAVALVALLEHVSGDSVFAYVPYHGEPGAVVYQGGQLIEKAPAVFPRPAPPAAEKPWWQRLAGR